MGCCDPRGCDQFFDARFAAREAERYRERGLDRNARRIVEFLERAGIDEATVLEVGGGIGGIQLELLERGASRCVNLELSPAYEQEARRLLDERALEARVERRLCDLAVTPGDVDPADVVVLHRVVCCYPDYERLLSAAAEHARRVLIFSYPPRNPVSRLVLGVVNLGLRARRRSFRTFAHPPSALLATVERHGLRPVFAHHGLAWHIAALERADAEPEGRITSG
jgi:magnesium-protoporphyrin O-methyltransferase